MPSKTFLGLPETKRNKIMGAVRQAFSNAPYSQVTVTDIIKLAEIPRGSFYQYFKDKEDLYFYLIETFRQSFKDDLTYNLKVQNGDFFAAVKKTFHRTLDRFTTAADSQLLQNVIMEMDYRGYHHLMKRDIHHRPQNHQVNLPEWQQNIKDQTDFTKLRVSRDEFDLLFHTLLSFMGQSFAHYFIAQRDSSQKLATEPFKAKFDLLLDWLEHGVLIEDTGRELNA
ncbi:hypothetical protein FC84_GL001102 [Lapidilactobacillus dextrinicus DSM 20335]|uniref:HTH tetR-type domain-containing protein n=1 Tax=Lapidilactobacillus dextrinicus DSM 20335 TaxID=1423738 RepID=A0A0R2BPU9_9LACO|nr:TetR/AcrR family transcriptional regulator [Lapidilactobacillus dextrinicus]KRM78281.1 hypothetical protein FC84_GL001102 [Lapidilactobacillus dextrinicus DSM 20335]QFG47278.1 TetR/AcrR family transcriptional regulator [Lapidilactobacillus dextrinicus]